MSTIFDYGGQEYFTYELLTLSGGVYKHSQWISNYVDKCSIDIDFDRSIITGAKFDIQHLADINYLSDLIKPWYNFVTNGITYTIPLGHYMLSSPQKKSDGNYVSRNIEGCDLLKALDQDKTIVSKSFSSGVNVVETIEGLLDDVGTWVNYSIEPSDETLSEDVSYELGKSTLFIINSLLNMINYYPLWVNGNGVYKGVPWSDTPNISYEFIDNDLSLYEENVNLDVDYNDIYNRVIIINNQLEENTEPLYKVWTMEDEGLQDHPFSYTSIERYITKIFQSEAVSQSYVDLRARRELRKMLEIEESVIFKHAFVTSRLNDGIPWQGDAYKFKNELLDLDYTYKIVKQAYSLETGVTVNSTIKRVKLT
jgi:hypothetical protein